MKNLKNNRGSAMITALVVGLVIFAFCLSMLLVSYTLFAQTSRQNSQLQCKNIAQSFSEELALELEGENAALKDPTRINAELVSYLKSEINTKLAEVKSAPNPPETPVVSFDMKLKPSGNAADELSAFTVTAHFTATSASSVDTVITCVRGNANDRDVQTYSVQRTYRLK